MIRRALFPALIAAVLSAPAPAHADARAQLLALVRNDFREFGIRDVDPNSLSTHKLAAINAIAHLKRPRGGKRALILSEIGGRNTLRSLFSR